MEKTLNTYISIDLFIYPDNHQWDCGRVYISCESTKLKMHLDVNRRTAEHEMAKLMLRTGKMPRVYGPGTPAGTESTMYSLGAFLD